MLGCNINDNITAEVAENKEREGMPICLPVSFIGIPIILLELLKTFIILKKNFVKFKNKYIMERQREKVILLMLNLNHNWQIDIIPRRVNSVPNITNTSTQQNRKSSLQITLNPEDKTISSDIRAPTSLIVCQIFKCFLLKSNLIYLIIILIFSLTTVTSYQTPYMLIVSENICSYFAPIFLFLTEAKLRILLTKKISKIVPLNLPQI